MFKQLVKLTLVSVIWKRYKAAILSTLLLFAYYWLVEKLHADFLNYLSLQKSEANLGISFVVKWLLLIIGLSGYLAFNFLRRRAINPTLPHVDTGKSKTAEKGMRQAATSVSGPDPFARIREKKHLRNKGDFILDKDGK